MIPVAGSIVAIVPALNEEASIAQVVLSLRRAGIGRVRVVDNGSSDRTAEIARNLGAEVLHEPHCGYGAACWRGLIQLPNEAEWILFCDADGSDDLDQLPEMIRFAGGRDLVLGARVASPDGKSGVTFAQRFGNALATNCIAWGWGHRFRDMGPFRLIRRSALEHLDIEDRTWGWTLEMQVRAVEERLRIAEIPVRSLPRSGGRSKIGGSFAGAIRAGARIIATLVKLYWRRRHARAGLRPAD